MTALELPLAAVMIASAVQSGVPTGTDPQSAARTAVVAGAFAAAAGEAIGKTARAVAPHDRAQALTLSRAPAPNDADATPPKSNEGEKR